MALNEISLPSGKVITVDEEGVVFNTGKKPAVVKPKPHPVAIGMFASYQAISISNMQQRAVGIRTRLQQWTIDSYFRNAVQLATQLGIIPMAQTDTNLSAFMPAVPEVSDSPELKAVSDRQDKMEAQLTDFNELLVAVAKKVGAGD